MILMTKEQAEAIIAAHTSGDRQPPEKVRAALAVLAVIRNPNAG